MHPTGRQEQILALVAVGLSDKQIAARLGVSVNTVRSHLQRVYREHNLRNRAEAAAAWTAARPGAKSPPAPSSGATPIKASNGARRIAVRAPLTALVVFSLIAALAIPVAVLAGHTASPGQRAIAGSGRTAATTAPLSTAAPIAPASARARDSSSATYKAFPVVSPQLPLPAPAAQPPVPANAASLYITEAQSQLNLINADRGRAGLPSLIWSSCLATIARLNARRLAEQGYVSPASGLDEDLACGLGSVKSGENMAYWAGINDGQANAVMMANPVQKATILGPFRYTGAAWATRGAIAYLVVEFG